MLVTQYQRPADHPLLEEGDLPKWLTTNLLDTLLPPGPARAWSPESVASILLLRQCSRTLRKYIDERAREDFNRSSLRHAAAAGETLRALEYLRLRYDDLEFLIAEDAGRQYHAFSTAFRSLRCDQLYGEDEALASQIKTPGFSDLDMQSSKRCIEYAIHVSSMCNDVDVEKVFRLFMDHCVEESQTTSLGAILAMTLSPVRRTGGWHRKNATVHGMDLELLCGMDGWNKGRGHADVCSIHAACFRYGSVDDAIKARDLRKIALGRGLQEGSLHGFFYADPSRRASPSTPISSGISPRKVSSFWHDHFEGLQFFGTCQHPRLYFYPPECVYENIKLLMDDFVSKESEEDPDPSGCIHEMKKLLFLVANLRLPRVEMLPDAIPIQRSMPLDRQISELRGGRPSWDGSEKIDDTVEFIGDIPPPVPVDR